MSRLSRPRSLSLPKTVAALGAAGAVVVLGATMALAANSGSGSSAAGSSPAGSSAVGSPAADPSAASTSAPADRTGNGRRASARALLRHAAHATMTVQRKDGFVTYTLVRGQVGSVSSTSISVKANDGFSATYAVTADTTVNQVKRGATNPRPTIGSIKAGDTVRVIGTGTSSLTATRIIIGAPKSAPAS